MNKFYFAFLILSFILVSSVFAAELNSCLFKSSCGPGEILLFKVTGSANAHAELASQNNYQTLICCGGSGINNACQANSATILRLSSVTNAHVEQNTLSNYGQRACLSSSDGTPVTCGYASDCSSLGSNYKCVAEISSITNAHVGDCSSPYAIKVCCAVPGVAGGVSRINLNLVPSALQIGGQTSIVTAEACLDLNCNTRAPDGTVVNFNVLNIIPAGANIGSLSSSSAQTVNGIATVTFTSGNQAGTGDIHASAGIIDRSAVVTVTTTVPQTCVISNVEMRQVGGPGDLIPSGQVILAGTDVKFRFTATDCIGKTVSYKIWEMENPIGGPLTEDTTNGDVSGFTSPPSAVQITQNPQTIDRLWEVQHRFDPKDAVEDGNGGDLEWEYAFKAVVDGNAIRSSNYIQLPTSSLQCRIDQAQIIHPTDDNYIYADGVTLDKQLPVRFRVFTSGNCGGKRLTLQLFDFNEATLVRDDGQLLPIAFPLVHLADGLAAYNWTWNTEYRTGDNEGDNDIEYIFKVTEILDATLTRDSDNWIQVQDVDGSLCGNGVINRNAPNLEECDGTDLDGKGCRDIPHTPSFTGGPLSCVRAGDPNQCRFDTSQCTTGSGGPGTYTCGGRQVNYRPDCNPPGSYCSNSYLICANDCKSCIGIEGNTKTILTRTPCRDDGNGDDVGVYDETTVQVDIRTNQQIPGTLRIVPKECTLTSEVDIPFFTPLNVIMVLALISIYYFFFKSKDKKKIRKV